MPPQTSKAALTGVLLGVLLAAVEHTIVGTALPNIVTDLGDFHLFVWVAVAYLVTATIAVPISGSLGDLVGRRKMFLLGLAVFVAGSLLSGLATSMPQLILFRAIQGLGGGTIFPTAVAALADMFPIEKRAKGGAIIGGVFGVASIIGPALGGLIAREPTLLGLASWRWIFLMNVPLGAASIALVYAAFPASTPHPDRRADVLGMSVLSVAIGTFLMATALQDEAVGRVTLVALYVVAALSAVAFVLIERRSADPMLPLQLFADARFTASAIGSFAIGGLMFVTVTLLPTYIQGVHELSPTAAGMTLVPMMLLVIVGVGIAGFVSTRQGYRPAAILGGTFLLAGQALLWIAILRHDLRLVIAGVSFLGIGLGATIQTFVLAAQSIVRSRDVGVTTATMVLTRAIGATASVAAGGVILTRLSTARAQAAIASSDMAELLRDPAIHGDPRLLPSVLVDPDALERVRAALGDPVIAQLQDAFASAFAIVTLVVAALALITLVSAAFLGKERAAARQDEAGAEAATA